MLVCSFEGNETISMSGETHHGEISRDCNTMWPKNKAPIPEPFIFNNNMYPMALRSIFH